MKKIPTLFKRYFENHKIIGITPEVTPGCEEAFEKGIATVKYDGSCCMVKDGKFYKRYDVRKGKQPPKDAIPCCEPDPITGHHPHWVEVKNDNPADKWFSTAFLNSNPKTLDDGTYEAIGPHFQSNPYNVDVDILVKHGADVINIPRTFDHVKEYLTVNEYIEGIVFWLNGEPVCKIKRSDFGLPWNKKTME